MRVAVVAVLWSCQSDPAILQLDGRWNIQEQFADDIHLVSCSGLGWVAVTQEFIGDAGNGPTQATAFFTGVAGVDTDCTSLDGPFNYFGDGAMSRGRITPGRTNQVLWDAMVNDAVCQYEGIATGDGVYGLEMSGTLDCTLEDPGVTFRFLGTWEARSSRSEWCQARLDLPGCSTEDT